MCKSCRHDSLGIVECAHCGQDFDHALTASCNPTAQFLCEDCLDIYLANYEPAEQSYYES